VLAYGPISEPVLTCLAEVEPREVSWLWLGRMALGRLTLLVGRPGEGKSFVTCDMAARISTGTPWPDGSANPAGSVILISAEDDAGDTIRPRLDACGADVSKIHLLSAVRHTDELGQPREMMFTLADIPMLEAALRRVPDCRLIVIDPIGSFLGGGTDAHRDNEVRSYLAPVAQLAEKYGPAVLVVAHRRKGSGSNADELALGSRAFTGIARAVWHLSRDNENKARRLLLPGKDKLAPEGGGLAFAITGSPAAVEWEDAPVTMNADDGLALENGDADGEAKPGPKPEARNVAVEWLRELLANEPRPTAEVMAEANAAGYAWRTVRRAADVLEINIYKPAFDKGWAWRLPEDPPQVGQEVGQVAPKEKELGQLGQLRQNIEKTNDFHPHNFDVGQVETSWTPSAENGDAGGPV